MLSNGNHCEDQRMKTNVVLLFHSLYQCNRGKYSKYNIDNGHLKITNYVYPIIMSNTMEVHVQKSLVKLLKRKRSFYLISHDLENCLV